MLELHIAFDQVNQGDTYLQLDGVHLSPQRDWLLVIVLFSWGILLFPFLACLQFLLSNIKIWIIILIYRGDNGELRVGVRHLSRHQSSMPPSVISSQSMHLGVLATASHAITTQTLFVVYYKPRYYLCLASLDFALFDEFLWNFSFLLRTERVSSLLGWIST